MGPATLQTRRGDPDEWRAAGLFLTDRLSPEEQERFVTHLAGVQQGILDSWEKARKKDPDAKIEGDSPVYTFLPGMTVPEFEGETALVPPPYIPPDEREARKPGEGESLASIIDAAEAAKNGKDFPEAIRLFQKAIDTELEAKKGTGQEKKPDLFLAQRLGYHGGGVQHHIAGLHQRPPLFHLEQVCGDYVGRRVCHKVDTAGFDAFFIENKQKTLAGFGIVFFPVNLYCNHSPPF